MKIAVVKKSDLSIMMSYEDESPNQSKFGGELGWSEATIHLPYPNGVTDQSVLEATEVDGQIVLQVNSAQEDAWKRAENLKELNAFRAEREALADQIIGTALVTAFGEIADQTTYLMMAMGQLDIAMNVAGNKTQQEIDDAKALLVTYRGALAAVQAERVDRDADIAAFEPTHTDVDPLYPA